MLILLCVLRCEQKKSVEREPPPTTEIDRNEEEEGK